jgi:hypothetical protein
MELLTDLVCLGAFVAFGVWFLFALSDADETINEGVRMITESRKDRPPYDHEAEGDFPTWPREDHSPMFAIGVQVACSCGDFSHFTPLANSVGSAKRSSEDEFWATHMQEVAA